MFLSCVFINFIFVFLTSGQDCNSGMQQRTHFLTDMKHNICRPVNNSDVSLGYQFCKNITFILYFIYNVRYNKMYYSLKLTIYSHSLLNSVSENKAKLILHCIIKTLISNIVGTTRFWNNLYQVRSKSKYWKAK